MMPARQANEFECVLCLEKEATALRHYTKEYVHLFLFIFVVYY